MEYGESTWMPAIKKWKVPSADESKNGGLSCSCAKTGINLHDIGITKQWIKRQA
jgi:hypothetical protein